MSKSASGVCLRLVQAEQASANWLLSIRAAWRANTPKRRLRSVCIAIMPLGFRSKDTLSCADQSGVTRIVRPAGGPRDPNFEWRICSRDVRMGGQRVCYLSIPCLPRVNRNQTPESMAKSTQLAAQARQRKADEAYADLYPVLVEKRQAGQSLQQIADSLNAEGYTTRRGKPWNKMQVKLVLDRAARIG